jgi:oxygen-independent coproporphyrinogen-3 oxidase
MLIPADIIDLIQKYDRPGPRYTSYPTAPHFSDEVAFDALEKACADSNGLASLYIHIPFCESNCWFCGCNTIITTRHKSADSYLGLLEKELDLIEASGLSKRQVNQIHLGGGTPNFLSPKQIERLFEILRERFVIQENAEISVEMAPNYLDDAKLDAFVSNGLKRASFGIQDIQPDVQKAINRVQPETVNRWTVDALRQRGIESINIDLVYGLPYQTVDSYLETLEFIAELDPERLAVFNYAHVPHMKPYQARLEKHPMPSPETKIDLLLTIIKQLSQLGYEYIGMDHFAKPEDELTVAQKEGRLHRNFQGYTVQDATEVIALGISSISETKLTYRQNHKTLAQYEASLNEGTWPIHRGLILSEEDDLRRKMIRSLMCNLRLSSSDFLENEQEKVQTIIESQETLWQDMNRDELITYEKSEINVTDVGRLFLRNIAMGFDAYLGKGNAKFSRTV